VNAIPPMNICVINKTHHTPEGIQETGIFSINIPSRALVKQTDYCGLVSGKNVDKSTVFTVFYGKPLIQESRVNLECTLVQTVDLPTNYLFIGEIVQAYIDPHCIVEERPDFRKIDPLILTMPDNRYWSLGASAGKAWNIGKK